MQAQLPVVHALGRGSVFKQSAQLRREGQAKSACRIGADSDAEVDLFLRSFRDIEQRRRGQFLFFRFLGRRLHGIERKGKAVLACGGVELVGLFGAGFFNQFDRSSARRGRQVAQHGRELKLGEQRAGSFKIGRLGLHRVQVELERHAAIDGDKLFGKQDGIAILPERFADFASDFREAV